MLLLTDLPFVEWATWWALLLGYGVVLWFVLEKWYGGEVAAILRYLEASEAEAPADVVRDAFSAVASLPIRMQRREFVMNFLPALLFPVAMELLGHSGWLAWGRLRTYVFASLVGALFSSGLIFYWAKHSFASLRGKLALAVGSPAIRAGLIERCSLVQKLRFAVTMPALASVLLVVNVVYDSLQWVAQESAISWSEKAVDAVASGDPDLALEEKMRARLPDPAFWPAPLEMQVLSSAFEAGEARSGLSAAFREGLEGRLAEGADRGRIAPGRGGQLGAYRRMADGSVLLAIVEREDLVLALGKMNRAVVWVCLAMAMGALLIGALVCQDLRSALTLLRDEADRMASGDLRAGDVFESEDELGDLGRAFEAMGNSLRATVSRVHGAADRVERTAADVSSVVGALSLESREQFGRIRKANELMLSIHAQIREVSASAQALNISVEESSSSVLELGASGEDLNQTASVLSAKVDEVSASIEEMVRSVKQVGATTGRLTAASEETSSSMEEMAKAMRMVDASAETTASLSKAVVEKAELGQTRVSQTIAGMDAIRRATDVAERVIRGLGARTDEIGGILDVIDDVAEETNLLALNAAIIAAQAGEQGRAFSVVADEIKELADRVLASTKEIGGLIRAVQEESENAIGAIEAGSASVQSGVELSAEAGRTLQEITDASRESGGRISEIVSSVREQTSAASHVVHLMERVRDSAEQIASAGTDQDRSHEVMHRSALTMREVAQQVHATTEEQSRGFGQIRENVEGVRATVEQINGSLQEQSQACGHVAEFLEQVFEGTKSNEAAAGRMGAATEELLGQAEVLRRDVERFRIS
jgi:methyl-accepting chemotaxis protein